MGNLCLLSVVTFGIRQMELVNLKIQDVNLGRGTPTIFEGKCQRGRVLPLGDRAGAWMHKYLEDVRPKLVNDDDNGHLFLTQHGEPFINHRMPDLIKKYKKAVGIDKPGLCHLLFRHSMATHMLDNGADSRYVQMMLGHKHLSSTQIYTQVSIVRLKEVHKATHPAKLR